MKNKIFIRSLFVTVLAFVLYTANMHRVENAELKVVEPKTSKVAKKQKAPVKEPKAPKIASAGYVTTVRVEKGSQKKLAEKIQSIMGKDNTYQVAFQDLNNSSKYVRLGNSKRAQDVNDTMKLYLLLSLYKKAQSGKIGRKTAIKIKKADLVKGEQMLQLNMAYGIAYLRQAMMRGNKTAANALLRKVGKKYVNQVAHQFGANQTEIVGKFSSDPVGHTTANNLDTTLKGLYQGRVLKRQHAYTILGALHGQKNKLTSKISGTSYGIGDDNSAFAIVQNRGHSYCMSVWCNDDKNFAKLGKAIETWVNKH